MTDNMTVEERAKAAIERVQFIRAISDQLVKSGLLQDGVHFGWFDFDSSGKPKRSNGEPTGGRKAKSLFKPGALTYAQALGLSISVEMVPDQTFIDPGTGLYHYTMKTTVSDPYGIAMQTYGVCTSKEKKYYWRSNKPVCPKCGKETVFKSKRPGEGFYCWTKEGGCGAQFTLNDPDIIGQETGVVVNPDMGDLVHTIQSMAWKRAMVAAVVAYVAVADPSITHGLEDMDQGSDVNPDTGAVTPRVQAPAKAPAKSSASTLTDTEKNELMAIATDLMPGVDRGTVSATIVRAIGKAWTGGFEAARQKIVEAIQATKEVA